MTAAWVLTVGCLSTALALWVLRPLAARSGLIDLPNQRKSHDGPVPLVGGLAIYFGFVTTCLVAGVYTDPHIASFMAAGGILVGVGMIDDWREISPLARLIAQSTAALIMCMSGVVVYGLGDLFVPGDTVALGVFAVPFTVFATVALINSVNMSDGLDGLAGSQTLISLGGILAVAALNGGSAALEPLLAITGCTLAFLAFNLRHPWRRRAAVFLGDAGSNFLGFVLAWSLVQMSQGGMGYVMPAAALWFVSIQVFDTVEIVARRLMRGRSPFDADREHLHHVFLLAGFSVGETVLAMGLLAFGGVVVGVIATLVRPPDGAVLFGFVTCGVLFLGFILRTWRTMQFLRRSICRRKMGHDRRRAPTELWRGYERRSPTDRRALPLGALRIGRRGRIEASATSDAVGIANEGIAGKDAQSNS